MSAEIRVLAIASAGGHWVQLWRLRPAWKGCTVTYVSTSKDRFSEIKQDAQRHNTEIPGFYCVVDANRWQKLKLLKQLCQIAFILLRVRPTIVISTGAAPGYFALRFGKLFGARTIWLDSIANAQQLSLSGKKAGSCADLWLTQWEHLTLSEGNARKRPQYKGTVI